jgi:hypothetical protein
MCIRDRSPTGWSGGTTFGTTGTALISGDGVFKQGTDSQSEKIAKNNAKWIQWIGTAKDMSATDTHLYWWLLTAIRPNMTAMEIRIGDGAGAYTGWTQDAFTDWDGSWKCFVQDLAATPDTISGVIDLTDITIVGVFYSTVASTFRAIENCWVDAVRFGTGLTATGTDFDLADIAADDQLVDNQYGILENIDDVIFSQGKINIGKDASTTTFNSTNEVLVFRDAAVSATLYDFNIAGSACDADIISLTARAAGTTATPRFVCDFSGSNTFTMTGSAFTRSAELTFNAAFDIQNTVFNDCYQIEPSTAIFQNNTISNYVGTPGALLYPSDDSNMSDLTFILNDNAIEYDATSDATSPAIVNFIFDDSTGKYDFNNTSGLDASISLSGTSNANSYNPGGNLTNFLTSITLSMTVTDEAGDPVVGAQAYIDDDNETPYIMKTTTNGSGVASTTWTEGTVLGSTWRVRLYGYKPYKAIVDIGAADIAIPVTLVVDPQQT